jgi:hypothetical protein
MMAGSVEGERRFRQRQRIALPIHLHHERDEAGPGALIDHASRQDHRRQRRQAAGDLPVALGLEMLFVALVPRLPGRRIRMWLCRHLIISSRIRIRQLLGHHRAMLSCTIAFNAAAARNIARCGAQTKMFGRLQPVNLPHPEGIRV